MAGPRIDDVPAGSDRWRTYRITHATGYRYSDVVTASYGRGFLRPRELPWQHCVHHLLTVTPGPSDAAEGTDVFGNTENYFHVTTAHDELTVTAVSEVRVRTPDLDPEALIAPWESSRVVGTDVDATDFQLTSPLVGVSSQVRDYAEVSFRAGRTLLEVVRDLTHRIFTDFTYRSGTTSVGTSIAQVMAEREGVCQDFAHLAVACLRAVGLPGRYVSGYLATDPPPGKERMIGVDATHAWAAVRLAGGGWLAFDPTNDQLADERYTTVAWGRDYADVPPLRGVIFTDAKTSTMTVAVDVDPLPAH